MTYLRPIRVLAAGALVAALAATVGTAANAAPAPTPTSPAPTSPAPGDPAPDDGTACPPQDGIVVTRSMVTDLAGADGHGSVTPRSGSFGTGSRRVDAGCGKTTSLTMAGRPAASRPRRT